MVKALYCTLFLMLSLSACKNGKNETTQEEKSEASAQIGKEVAVFYDNNDSLMYVKRYIVNGNTYSQLSYSINISPLGFMLHKNLGKIDFPDEEAFENSKSELSEYNWQPKNGSQELVIKIKHHAFKSDAEEIAAGTEIIKRVQKKLEEKGLDKKGAYAMGDDELNITFIVDNVDESLKLVIEVLEDVIGSYKLYVATAIARKIWIKDNNFFFEVIYPQQFSGFFNAY